MAQSTGISIRDSVATDGILLQAIARGGWTEELADEFDRLYGEDIRRLVVLYLWRLGLVAFRFNPDRAKDVLSCRQLEVLDNTLSDLWLELVRGLVASYVRGRSSGRIGQAFLAYLAGTIRNLVIENAQAIGLLPRESSAEMLKALCQARKQSTYRYYMACVKFRLQHWAEDELLSRCPENLFPDVHRCLGHVVDYFFEQYVPGRCEWIARRGHKHLLEELASGFQGTDYRTGQSFVGAVTPFSHMAIQTELPHIPDDASEEEFLSILSARGGAAFS